MNNTNFKIFVKICFTLILISGNFLVFAQEQNTKLTLDTGELHELKLQDINGEYQIQTLGKNPYLFTLPLTSERKKENVALSFEYFCPKGLDFFKIHFGKNATVKTIKSIGVAEGWVTFSIDLTDDLKNWGKTGDQLRFDFGSRADVEIQIRNIVIRKPTEREQEIAAKREEKQKAEATMEVNLKNYLSKSYMAQIAKVKVAENELTITGNTPNVSQVFLAEITPYQDVTELKDFKNLIPIKQKTFFFKIKRFNKKEGFNYDRVLSKWVLVKKTTKGFQLLSHAHYPDEIYAKNNFN
jgi:hypothetical protein